MHLVFSSLITEKRLHLTPGTEGLRNRDRVSVAASTLVGLADLGITSADFYLSFDESTKWAEDKILALLGNLGFEYTLHPKRLESFPDWVSASNLVVASGQTQMALFTNDDHLKVTEDNEEFKFLFELVAEAQKAHPDITIMLPLSHFPEVHSVIPIAKVTNLLRSFRRAPLIPCQIPAVPMVLSVEKFKSFWVNDFTNGARIVGLENPFGPSLRLSDGFYLPPRQELLRHADSYGHIGVSEWPFQVLNPSVVVSRDTNEKVHFGIYNITCKKGQSEKNQRLTVLGEVKSGTPIENAAVSILKSSLLRPSLTSVRWILTRYELSKRETVKSVLAVFPLYPKIAASIFRSVFSVPFLLLLNLARVIIRVVKSQELEKHLIWFLTYGSSIGFLRLASMSAKSRLRKAD